MKLMWGHKDGGPESRGWMWGIEIKGLFSILLLKFEDGTREAYHSHAFNAVSWLLGGTLIEYEKGSNKGTWYWPSLKPIITRRTTFHQVRSLGRSWAISFRGPWVNRWHEYIPCTNKHITLTHGRKVVA